MKIHLCTLVSAFMLLANFNVEAANVFPTDVSTSSQIAAFASDSLIQKEQIAENNPATVSMISGLGGGFAGVTGLVSLSRWEFSWVFLLIGGILGIIALVSGATGSKRRRQLLKTTYQSRPDARSLPLGQGRVVLGVLTGIIGTAIFALILGLIAAYAG